MKNKAFTLVELLVVISIIALLAIIIFVSLAGARKKAMDATEKHNLSQISTAIEAYFSGDGDSKYPWDTNREPAGPWTWQDWQDTPCGDACVGPNTVCVDTAASVPSKFLEQLRQTGYFTQDDIDHMIGVDTGRTDILDIYYFYTCDLQEYKMVIRLSDGSCYEVGHNITHPVHSCPAE